MSDNPLTFVMKETTAYGESFRHYQEHDKGAAYPFLKFRVVGAAGRVVMKYTGPSPDRAIFCPWGSSCMRAPNGEHVLEWA